MQIDVENPERFGIRYVEEDGTRQHPVLLHTSVSGSVDRSIYAILEGIRVRAPKRRKYRSALMPRRLPFRRAGSPVRDRTLPIVHA